MKDQRGNAIQSYAAGYMLPITQDLLHSLEGIQSRKEIEDIHDLRVASRRIRTVLQIFGDQFAKKKVKNWMEAVRTITRTYGTTRDLDVQISFLEKLLKDQTDRRIHTGLHRIYLRLLQKRNNKAKIVGKHTDALLNDKSIVDMLATTQEIHAKATQERLPQALYELAFHTLQTTLDQFLSYEIFIHQVDRIHELHLMRIAAKRLRYTLEVFSVLYEGQLDTYLAIMRDVQQQLGEIRDCDVWMEFIPVFMEKEKKLTQHYYGRKDAMKRLMPGIEFLEQNRRKERVRLYKGFVKNWELWRNQAVWLHLRELILQATLSRGSDYDNDLQQTAER